MATSGMVSRAPGDGQVPDLASSRKNSMWATRLQKERRSRRDPLSSTSCPPADTLSSQAGPMDRSAVTPPSILLALLLAIAYSTDRTLLVGRIVTLESERESLHGRFDLLERAFTSLLAQPGAAALPARRLEEPDVSADDSRATVHIDAPDGISEVVLGGEHAEDNVILSKAHLNEGAAFTISRNETGVLSIGGGDATEGIVC